MQWRGTVEEGRRFPLDKVELLSGPIFSDIKQGCIEPAASSITVCPSGQFGCVLGTQQPWSVPPAYVYGSEVGVRTWSGDDTCAWVPGGTASADSNADWKEMSIVDGTTNPTFTYPKTRNVRLAVRERVRPVQLQRGPQPQRLHEQLQSRGAIVLSGGSKILAREFFRLRSSDLRYRGRR